MFKLILRLFSLFLFVIHTQPIMAKETDNQFDFPYIIANYSLTEDFLLKIEEIGKKCDENLLSTSKPYNTEYDDSIEGQIASISARPKLMGLLRKKNLTAKDYIIGIMTLQATLIILNEDIENLKKEGIFFDEKNTVVSDNLEFGKKHTYRILKILRSSCK
ncbi:Uncharacterised protein [Candidatus Bartonella washoeensis]|uniref:Uncharacterized protein n=1 Tax=Candidatus Bartonella washoeensis Sb944nv TaxID=1094563 RepID=J1J4Y7_9HYPH|nr:hypothetical protein [Bartonella washoeensis]EJF79227.1 hypothetical protein MCQ_00768 [Bartonella washoeensis Sb944nv]SPU28004.1 Uncharacterised protein [Bartonella washoeensis]